VMEPEEIVLQITNRLDAGFGKIHEKVDSLREDFTSHKELCGTRFSSIETDLVIRKTTNNIKDVAEKDRLDWGRWAVRGIMATSAGGIMLIVWKVLTGAVKIIEVVK